MVEGQDRKLEYFLNYTIEKQKWLEEYHSWVQYAFPTTERSSIHPNMVMLRSVGLLMKNDPSKYVQINMGNCLRMFGTFLFMKGKQWYLKKDHNKLRMTRAITSAKLFGVEDSDINDSQLL